MVISQRTALDVSCVGVTTKARAKAPVVAHARAIQTGFICAPNVWAQNALVQVVANHRCHQAKAEPQVEVKVVTRVVVVRDGAVVAGAAAPTEETHNRMSRLHRKTDLFQCRIR